MYFCITIGLFLSLQTVQTLMKCHIHYVAFHQFTSIQNENGLCLLLLSFPLNCCCIEAVESGASVDY